MLDVNLDRANPLPRRDRGITVAGTPERAAVLCQVRQLLQFAREQG